MLMLFNNHADAGTYSGGVWTIPLTKIQDPRPSNKARSSGLSLTNTQFRVTLASAKAIRAPVVTHTNLSSAAQYKWTWYSDAFVTEISNTGWQSIPGYPADDPDDVGAAIFHIFNAAVTAQYWKCELSDAGNSDGYVEVGRVVLADTWEPTRNFVSGATDGMTANTPRQTAMGGTAYYNRRQAARSLSFAFNHLSTDEAQTVRRIRKIVNLNKQVVVMPDTSSTNINDRSFLANLADLPEIELLAIHASFGFRAIEAI